MGKKLIHAKLEARLWTICLILGDVENDIDDLRQAGASEAAWLARDHKVLDSIVCNALRRLATALEAGK